MRARIVAGIGALIVAGVLVGCGEGGESAGDDASGAASTSAADTPRYTVNIKGTPICRHDVRAEKLVVTATIVSTSDVTVNTSLGATATFDGDHDQDVDRVPLSIPSKGNGVVRLRAETPTWSWLDECAVTLGTQEPVTGKVTASMSQASAKNLYAAQGRADKRREKAREARRRDRSTLGQNLVGKSMAEVRAGVGAPEHTQNIGGMVMWYYPAPGYGQWQLVFSGSTVSQVNKY